MKEIFETIIRNRLWQDVTCGSGSTIEYTAPIRAALPAFLTKYNISSMLDAPCGDCSWMSTVTFPPGFKYIGGDIVEFMVTDNQQKYPNLEFLQLDLSNSILPDVDLLFCRDCLFHLSTNDIFRVLNNVANSNIQYILTTTYYKHVASNVDITTGAFRPIDLLQDPFAFPDYIDSIDDWIPGHAPRRMALWSVDTIRSVISNEKLSS